MSNIVAEDEYVIGTLKHLQVLRSLAEMKDIHFRENDYKWILGIKIVNELTVDCIYLRTDSKDVMRTLFGIPVDVDYYNPENVQLWKNITNDL